MLAGLLVHNDQRLFCSCSFKFQDTGQGKENHRYSCPHDSTTFTGQALSGKERFSCQQYFLANLKKNFIVLK